MENPVGVVFAALNELADVLRDFDPAFFADESNRAIMIQDINAARRAMIELEQKREN